MKNFLLAAIATVFALPAATIAQVNPAFAELTEATEQARSLAQLERKMIVSQQLSLSATESAAFWPVYDRYVADLKSANDLRVKAITDYAANYDNLSDAVAKTLIDDMLRHQEKTLKVRKSYLGRFRKALPETKLARFYQIENKLDAITSFALARQIPLVPQKDASPAIAQP